MTDHEVVSEFPRKTRGTKYPLKDWFDGQIHRLVQGRDFHIKDTSLKTTLYTATAKQPEFTDLKVKIHWEVEGGKNVAYVQAVPREDA